MSALAEKIAGQAPAQQAPRLTIEQFLAAQRPKLEAALPEHLDVDRFSRILLTEVKRTPELLGCTPESLLGAWLLTAQLGLQPGPGYGEVYLIPRWSKKAQANEVSFQLGYRGVIALARRSGEIELLEAHAIHAGDNFWVQYGAGESSTDLRHFPALEGRGDVVGAWAKVRFRGGAEQIAVVDLEELEARRARSDSWARNRSGPWATDMAAMARKSAIRKLEPYLPKSAEIRAAFGADEGVASFDGSLEVAAPPPIDAEAEEAPARPAAAELEPPAEPEAEPEPAAPSKRDVLALKVPALRLLLEQLGVEPKGSKAAMQEAALRALGLAEPEPEPEPAAIDAATAEALEEARSWAAGLSAEDLARTLHGLDLEASGDEAADRERIARLEIGLPAEPGR